MQIGGAIGALVGRLLPATHRERRILMVAGVAAGMAAVFRTPLGAALLATEMLYRDDFESDALVPAILASVVAYSVVISVFGETTLFGHPARFPFVPAHLGLYGLLAVVVAAAAVPFVRTLAAVQRLSARAPVPAWARPALGGLATGIFGTAIALALYRYGGARLGIFGGGYGVAQAAISGAPGLPTGWSLVAFFALLGLAKLVSSALTIGSGGVAGDFAPSLVMGGLLGSAFGHAASLLLHDPRIDPAAFALVGMGTFYGGIAHAPLSALVLVSELAGSYDLLVPMMLTVSLAFVALRKWSLYPAQPATKSRSHPLSEGGRAGEWFLRIGHLTARDVLVPVEADVVLDRMSLPKMLGLAKSARRQRVLSVIRASGEFCGLVDLADLLLLSVDELGWANAHDVMIPFAFVRPHQDLAEISRTLAASGAPQVPVLEQGAILGYVGETELARAYSHKLG